MASNPTTLTCLGYTGGIPTSTLTKTNSKVIEVAAGATFDGGWVKCDHGPGACNDQVEGGDSNAFFILHSRATLQNLIIGKNQAEGVHCSGPCIPKSKWFQDVYEDAITIKNDVSCQETWIRGGGAYHAAEKVVQHNRCGTVSIINFHVEDCGPLYRSCRNCSCQFDHNVYIQGTTAVDGGELAGVNSNYEDTATFKNCCYATPHSCQMYIGNSNGAEPTKSGYCSE
ncbi:hypothetical protein MFRU_015g00620 [Monilinia fructicola]|nr:hypothetical protein MFRU_015g00620 [Monilinia fructicola]